MLFGGFNEKVPICVPFGLTSAWFYYRFSFLQRDKLLDSSSVGLRSLKASDYSTEAVEWFAHALTRTGSAEECRLRDREGRGYNVPGYFTSLAVLGDFLIQNSVLFLNVLLVEKVITAVGGFTRSKKYEYMPERGSLYDTLLIFMNLYETLSLFIL